VIAPLPLHVERRESVPIARLAGEIEISRVGNLRDRLLRVLDNQDFGLVVDLSRATYVDSVGINVLFEVAERLAGRQMRLATVVPKDGLVSRVVSMVALNTVAGVHDDLEPAVAEIRALMAKER
jgi:anti-anti-sigma factor